LHSDLPPILLLNVNFLIVFIFLRYNKQIMDMEVNNQHHKITVPEMAPHVHVFLAGENKVDKIAKWLINWITLSLECGKIKPYDLMPSKADLACHIGVSQGTIQNAFRIVEDFGYLESKQRVGTLIKDFRKESAIEKLTSKRELAVEILKKFLKENDYQVGDKLPSTRNLAKMIGVSSATIRMAIINLVSNGILDKYENSFILSEAEFAVEVVQARTLVEKVAQRLKRYIEKTYKVGEKLPANTALAKKFKVSVKTIHDAVRQLSKEGLLYTRRGRYGTIVLDYTKEVSSELYDYEKVEQKIRNHIASNCQVGDKLFSIKEFSVKFKTSEKTVKKALDNLAEDGYLTFSRGRYGGTFVTDIPQASGEAYKWLAISNDYMAN